MEMLSARLDSAGLSPEKAERIEKRAQEKIRRAQEKLARRLTSEQKKTERKARTAAARARRRSKGRRHTWSFRTSPVAPAAPAGDPVSEEERLMILRMLEQKKISLAEADQLLAALEGKEL